MDKARLIAALRGRLVEELETVRAAAAAAIEGATHEEAKPENQYDTRGLEQSYLAGAQSARLEAIGLALATVEALEPRDAAGKPIASGSCVVLDDGEVHKHYFLSEAGGGTKLELDGQRWWVLNPRSPLGQRLLGRREGDVIEHVVRGEVAELEILSVC